MEWTPIVLLGLVTGLVLVAGCMGPEESSDAGDASGEDGGAPAGEEGGAAYDPGVATPSPMTETWPDA